jgi:hypothetical protein
VYLNDDPGMGPTYGFYTRRTPGRKAIFDTWVGALGDLKPSMKRNPVDKIGNDGPSELCGGGHSGVHDAQGLSGLRRPQHITRNADFYERGQ